MIDKEVYIVIHLDYDFNCYLEGVYSSLDNIPKEALIVRDDEWSYVWKAFVDKGDKGIIDIDMEVVRE